MSESSWACLADAESPLMRQATFGRRRLPLGFAASDQAEYMRGFPSASFGAQNTGFKRDYGCSFVVRLHRHMANVP